MFRHIGWLPPSAQRAVHEDQDRGRMPAVGLPQLAGNERQRRLDPDPGRDVRSAPEIVAVPGPERTHLERAAGARVGGGEELVLLRPLGAGEQGVALVQLRGRLEQERVEWAKKDELF